MAAPKTKIKGVLGHQQNTYVTGDNEMDKVLGVGKYKPEKPRNKVEADYIKGGSATAGEAIRRARRANSRNKTK